MIINNTYYILSVAYHVSIQRFLVVLIMTSKLCRFAQFFIAPLFTDSATEREVNAVNSENDKNIQNDAWRIHQLDKYTSKVGHDYCKFGTGKHC